jgi:hypothetical protein
MADFHRKTRGIVVLHRCMLNPADGTFHSLVLFLLGAPLPHLGAYHTTAMRSFISTNLVATVPRRMAELEASNPAIKILKAAFSAIQLACQASGHPDHSHPG